MWAAHEVSGDTTTWGPQQARGIRHVASARGVLGGMEETVWCAGCMWGTPMQWAHAWGTAG